MQWIYQQGATSFDDMHNFSKDLRQKLKAIASIDLPEVMTPVSYTHLRAHET